MTKSSSSRATKRALGDLANHVPETSLAAVANQLTDLVAMANDAWVKQHGASEAGSLMAHLLTILAARFAVQLSDPIKAIDHMRQLTLTHALGCIPDMETMHSKKYDELYDKLLLAGAIVTDQEKN